MKKVYFFFITADIVFTLPSHTGPAGDSCNTVSAAAQMALGTGGGGDILHFPLRLVHGTGRGGILHFPLHLAHGTGGGDLTSHSVSRTAAPS